MSKGDGGLNHDQTQILDKLSQVLAVGRPRVRALAKDIVRTLSDLIGDGCMLTLLDDEGAHLVNVACAHRDQDLEIAYNMYMVHLAPSKATSATVSAQVIRTGTPRIGDVQPAEMIASTDENLKPLVRKLNIHSFAVLPIRGERSVIGTISLVRSAPGRSYTDEDLALLCAVAEQIGYAIYNARTAAGGRV